MSWLLLIVAGCAGPDGSPVEAAKSFHERLLERDDAGAHAMLSDADRAAVPLARFPDHLPDGLAMTLFAWGETPLDSTSLLGVERDTAAVILHFAARAPDTVRLFAIHDSIGLGPLELERVRWRVSVGLAERVLLDSLAAAMRTSSEGSDIAGVEQARAYLEAAERYSAQASPADLDAARRLVRRAAVAEALRVELRVTQTFTGTTVVAGRIENPSGDPIGTLRLIVRDGQGAEDAVVLWGLDPGASATVQQVTRLSLGSLTHRVEEIQVF